MSSRSHSQAGVTLIELVVAMAILAIAIAGTLRLVQTTTRSSADPMLLQQATFIAEAYLEEILAKDFPVSPCPAPEAPGGRAGFSNVCNYAGMIPEPPTDQLGAAVPGMTGFQVQVNVVNAVNWAGLTGPADIVRVDVDVDYTGGKVQLSGYRTNL